MYDERRQGQKRPLAFRISPTTIERLQRRARETRETQTALVERYVEEGLRTDEHPSIYFREGAGGRRPALLGTRLDVWQVIETLRQNENSVEETADYLGIPVEKVRSALRYYADYEDEIDDWAARATAIAEREEANWRRQQELLG
jgi:uncharacterized protein (DUF433 family)